MNFSRIARQLNENVSNEVAAASSEKAKEGGEKQVNNTMRRRESQKAQMSQQGSTPVKSDVSYTSEEARREREYVKMLENNKSDWREELKEAMKPGEEGAHPYVDVMPSVNQKAIETKRQMKGAAKEEGAKQGMQAEGLGPQAEFKQVLKDLAVSQAAKKKTPVKKALRTRAPKPIPMDQAMGYGQNRYQGD